MTARDPDKIAVPAPRRRGTDERRRQLAVTAGRLIYERGFESLSVNDLADDFGMSVGGMYRYIRTKTDLLVMACEGIYGDLRDRIIGATTRAESPADRLRIAMQVYFDACEQTRELILVMYREYRHLPPDARARYQDREEAIAGLFADAIRSGIRERVFRAVDAELVARDIIMLGHMPALKGWSLRGHVGREAVAPGHIDLILGRLVSSGIHG